MSNIKSPRIFNPDEDDNYCVCKNDVEVCQAFTKEEPRWQGPATRQKKVPCHETGSKFLFRFVERWCRK